MSIPRASTSRRPRCLPTASALPQLVAPVLARFGAGHPGGAVALEVATSDVMLVQLAEGEVDLMVGRLTEGHEADACDSTPVLSGPQQWPSVLALPAHGAGRAEMVGDPA